MNLIDTHTHIYLHEEFDGTNADDLTRATLTCRRQMDDIVRYLREFVPGYEKCYLQNKIFKISYCRNQKKHRPKFLVGAIF